MGKILALGQKDLRILLRDRSGLTFVLLFPFLFAVFFGVVFSGNSGPETVPLAVVDLDESPGSRAFIDRLKTSSELEPRVVGDTLQARQLVQKRQVVGMLVLPEGFGRKKRNPFAEGVPEVVLGFDPAQRTMAGLLQGLITKLAFEDFASTFSDPELLRSNIRASLDSLGRNTDLPAEQRERLVTFLRSLDTFVSGDSAFTTESFQRFEPLRVRAAEIIRADAEPPNAFSLTFPQAIMFGIIGTVASFSLSIVNERNRGTLSRLRTFPVTGLQILAGKALACFAAVIGVTGLLILVAWAFFGVQVSSLPLLVASVAAVGVAFVGLMMLFAVSSRSERTVSGLTWAVMLPLAMLGGAMIPLVFMPEWLRRLGSLSPMKWAILSLEGALWRGLGPRELLLPWSVLVGIGIVSFALGVRLFNWKEN